MYGPEDAARLLLLAKALGGGGGGSAPVLISKTITENGDYDPADDSADGYDEVHVSVQGAAPVLEDVTITENGVTTPPAGVDGFSKVTASVPNTYAAEDEGKVVFSGALVPQTSSAVTANGLVDTTLINSLDVSVPTGGGGSDAEDGIIMRTISGVYENSRVTEIRDYAFFSCTSLTAVSFPAATSIGANAFNSCANLTTASFPVATTISASAFVNCYSLTTVSFPSVKSIVAGAFSACSRLTTVSFPVATSIGANAFAKCTGLTTVSFPSVTMIANSVFTNCTGLITASFQKASFIGSNVFAKCIHLVSFYLFTSSVATLSNSNAFSSTPVAGYTDSTGGVYGSIYVPSSLLTTYQSKTNWTYFSSRFVGVE